MNITNKAILKLKSLASPMPTIRIKVVGGGCSGLSYNLSFTEDPIGPNDKLLNIEDCTIFIDSKSYLFLVNTTLDFTDGLNGQGFVFNNLNAKRTCGCGSSFSF